MARKLRVQDLANLFERVVVFYKSRD